MKLKIVEAHYYQKELEVNMEVVRELKNDGIAKGLCRQWQMKLKDELDVADLSSLFIRGIDFCISENFPTLDYLRDNFRGKCEPYGIYIDEELKGETNIPDIVLNGSCKADLNYNEYSVSRLYIRHNSEVNVNVSEHAILTIDAFDNSRIEINTIGLRAKVFVHLYGNASIQCYGDGIKIKRHNKLTY